MVNWLFRNRHTGEITIGQTPNAPLIIWLVATVIKVIFDPSGATGTGALIVWAADEIVRGVNPFRRAIGAVVLAAIAVGFATR